MKHKRSFEEILAMVGWIIAVMFFLSVLASCTTERKAVNYFNSHPDLAAEYCDLKFPPKTEYKEGQTITKSDTIYKEGKTIPCPEPTKDEKGNLVPGFVKCPGEKIIRDTILRVDTIYQESTSLRRKFKNLEADNTVLKKDKKALIWTVVILALAALFFLFLAVRK